MPAVQLQTTSNYVQVRTARVAKPELFTRVNHFGVFTAQMNEKPRVELSSQVDCATVRPFGAMLPHSSSTAAAAQTVVCEET